MMRATCDSASLPLAPEAREAPRAVATADAAALLFAATLGVASSTVAEAAPDVDPGTDDKPGTDDTQTDAGNAPPNPFTGMQLLPMLPAPSLAKAGGDSGERSVKLDGFGLRPSPSGIDLTSFELIPADNQVALPLEAALQQLMAGMDKSALAQVPTSVAAPAPQRVLTPANEIVDVVSRHVARGEQHVTMVLRPAELGTVKVRVEHGRDNHVTIKLEAETKDATAVLRARIPELQATLAQQGVTVNSVDVSLSSSDAMHQQAAGGEPSPQQQRGQTDRDEHVEVEDTARTQKRTKRNTKDLDVVV